MKLFKAGSKKMLEITRSEWEKIGKQTRWIHASYQSSTGIIFESGKVLNLGPKGKATIVNVNAEDCVANLKMEDGSDLVLDMDTLKPVLDLEAHKIMVAKEKEEKKKANSMSGAEKRKKTMHDKNKKQMVKLFDIPNKGFFYSFVRPETPTSLVSG